MTFMPVHSPRQARILPAFLVGPILYILFVVVLVLPVTFVLDKAGVPVPILMWGAFATVALVTVVPAYFARQPGFAAFGNLDGTLPAPLLLPARLVAMGPAALAAAAWSGDAGQAGLGAAAMAVAFVLAALVSRFAPESDPIRLVETRSASARTGAFAALLVLPPMLALFCGQLAAFSVVAGHYLGIPASAAVALCIAMALLQIWLPGARGLVLGSIAWVSCAAVLVAALWLHPAEMTGVDGALPLSGLLAQAFPFLPAAAGALMNAGAWSSMLLHAVGLGAGLFLLPLFRAPRTAPGVRESGEMALLALLAAAAASGFLLLPGLPGGESTTTGAAPIQRGFALVLLLALSGLATICLHAMAMLVAERGEVGGRRDLPSRRLATARAAIVVLAIGGGWLALSFGDHLAAAARISLAIATAALLPVTLAALAGGSGAFARAAPPAMAAGVVVAAGWIAISGGSGEATLAGLAAAALVLAGGILYGRKAPIKRVLHP